jgi:Ca2+-transporting ATPase
MEKKSFHSLPYAQALEHFDVDLKKGLDSKEAKQRLEKHGRNALPEAPKRPAWRRFLEQFNNVLIYVLIAAAGITALMDHWIDTWVILAVVLVNAWIGFVQEGKAEEALDSIRSMLSPQAVTLRDEHWHTIDAEELVPGDIIRLKAGDKIPADLRLIKTTDFRLEEAALTGESVPIEKSNKPVDEGAVLGDQKCMAFSGTTVTFGEGVGVVTSTGLETELGKINQMMAGVAKITTPLLQQIGNFGKWLSVIIVVASVAFFALGYFFRDYELAELFLAVIGLIVAAIPEGLPAIMTITLAVGVQRMAGRNAIIRSLPSVETLGAVSVICSDKTGTLTRNEMTAKKVFITETEFEVEGTGYAPKGNITLNGEESNNHPLLQEMLQCVRATNSADVFEEDNQWKISGSPTEAALLVLCEKAGIEPMNDDFEENIPFSSEHKYAAQKISLDGKIHFVVNGAPDNLLQRCAYQRTENGREDIQVEMWEKKMEEAASMGLRMLGTAIREDVGNDLELKHDEVKDLTFLGFMGIIDPPREEAVEAIKNCKSAGVSVKMITGDHALTALAIAKKLGLGHDDKVITGVELEQKSDEELKDLVLNYDVYARTSPEHKLRLVTALQAHGLRVAMTGDGVNDAPALKKADIGVAMGIKGTEVSKEAAEMVLADDNFSSIVHAIEEGRTVYDNIRKSLLFMLPTNGAESLVIIGAIMLGIVMPVTPVQILWVNMVTAVTLAIALAFEPTEEGILCRKPRSRKSALLGKIFLWRIIFVSAIIGAATMLIFIYLKAKGISEDAARTVAVNTLVAGQLFYLFNCRTLEDSALNRNFFSNKYAFIAAFALLILQLAFVYMPFLNTFFGSEAIEFKYWIWSTAAGAIVFVMVELEKFILRKLNISELNT